MDRTALTLVSEGGRRETSGVRPPFCAVPVTEADRLAHFAASLVRPGLAILDVSCGSMAVERWFAPSLYRPVDEGPRDDRTEKWRPGLDSLSKAMFDKVALVTCLDRSHRHSVLLTALHELTLRTTPILLAVATDFEAEITLAASNHGFDVALRASFEHERAVLLLAPVGRDVSPILEKRTRPAHALPKASAAEDSLLIVGHFGQGNCAEEALIQVAFEFFSPRYRIVAGIDAGAGIASGFDGWYPYNQCRLAHHSDLACLGPELRGALVIGGNLPFGFAADYAICARAVGAPVALVGVDTVLSPCMGVTEAARYYDLFDLVAPRSEASLASISAITGRTLPGADWGLNLITDRSHDIGEDRERILLAVRAPSHTAGGFNCAASIRKLIGGAAELGYRVHLLPFTPEDEAFGGASGLDQAAPTIKLWSNPRRMKQMIAESGVLISVGRAEPAVFAVSARTPVALLSLPAERVADANRFRQVRGVAADLGIDIFDEVGALLTALDDGRLRPSSKRRLDAAALRLNNCLLAVDALFGMLGTASDKPRIGREHLAALSLTAGPF